MADHFVETSKKGFFARVSNSVGGILIGVLMFLIAFPVLFWNEGRAVRRAQDLAFGKESVLTVKPDRADPAHDGKLVHVAGHATPTQSPVDPVFGVSATALKLERHVQMYQWQESSSSRKKENVGGSETTRTEYSYSKVWSEKHIDSGRFKHPDGHVNPGAMPYQSAAFAAKEVKLGGFSLAPSFLDELDAEVAFDATNPTLPNRAVAHGGGVYIGDPSSPAVGDVRITFQIAPEGVLTVVGAQANAMLDAYSHDELNGEIALIERGKKSAEEMFQSAQEANYFFTWMLRVIGFLVMFLGLRLAARPLSVIASIIPFVGRVVGFGTGLVAFFVALAFSAVTIAVAWLFYRPLLAIGLFLLAILAVVFAVVVARKMSAD